MVDVQDRLPSETVVPPRLCVERKQFRRSSRLQLSMSRRGNVCHNSVAESFFRSEKVQRIKQRISQTRDRARADACYYPETFYNRSRRPSQFDAGPFTDIGARLQTNACACWRQILLGVSVCQYWGKDTC